MHHHCVAPLAANSLNSGLSRACSIIIIIMKAKIIVTLYIKNVTGALYTVNYNENSDSILQGKVVQRQVVLQSGHPGTCTVARLAFSHSVEQQSEFSWRRQTRRF